MNYDHVQPHQDIVSVAVRGVVPTSMLLRTLFRALLILFRQAQAGKVGGGITGIKGADDFKGILPDIIAPDQVRCVING